MARKHEDGRGGRTIGDLRRMSNKVREQRDLCYRRAELSHVMGVYSPDASRAERLREALQSLYEANKLGPIIVEGKRDVSALRKIGFVGYLVTAHAGKSLYDLCDELQGAGRPVVLLMDWDSKGEQLLRNLSEHLTGLWEEFSPLRERLKAYAQKDINEVEALPSLLERLTGTAVMVGDEASSEGLWLA